MYKKDPKFRRKLTINQLKILDIIYRYRFVSAELLAGYLNKKDMHKQLYVLEDQGLIKRRYNTSYKLLGKPIAYYISTKGARILSSSSLEESVKIKHLYKARENSEQFIDLNMSILKISTILTKNYFGKVRFFTKIDIDKAAYDYFPKPLPNAYIRIEYDGMEEQFFFNVYPKEQPLFVIIRSLRRYLEYYDSGHWDDTDTAFPKILIVIENTSIFKKILRYVEMHFDRLDIYIANEIDLLKGDGRIAIWHKNGTSYKLDEIISN